MYVNNTNKELLNIRKMKFINQLFIKLKQINKPKLINFLIFLKKIILPGGVRSLLLFK